MAKHKKRILIAFGTRPEALKLVPLIRSLRSSKDFECLVCLTGQHRQMLDQVIDFFNIKINDDLRLMKTNQSLEYVSGRVVAGFGKIIDKTKPDLVFVQGDTATALMVGIASFYAKVPIAHLEAGLRTWKKFTPFPEEINRKLLTHLADIHFTPTKSATQNLLHEGISKSYIFQAGNTIVDTVRIAASNIKKTYPIFQDVDLNKKILFVTAHRRESFGRGLKLIFTAFKQIIKSFPNAEIVYPVHLNPNVLQTAHKMLQGIERIHLLRPLTYEETFWIMQKCYAILTDSGGIQEEAPSFKKPVLVLREVTERPEGVRAGIAKVVGTDPFRIFNAMQDLFLKPKVYKRMIAKRNPYGDGHAAEHILNNLRQAFRLKLLGRH